MKQLIEWEDIYLKSEEENTLKVAVVDYSGRSRVPGGWLIRNKQATVFNESISTSESCVFVADPYHEWNTLISDNKDKDIKS